MTPPLRAGIKPADGCWLSLGCSPLSLRGRGMTPPPPVCAALGIPRARLPSPRARSGLPLQLLLLLLGVAATTQGHPKSGPRISAIWKGRWRRAAGGARDLTPRGAGAECEARRECVRAALRVPGCPCGERAGLGECECARWHAGAAGTLRGASGWAGAPAKSLQVARSRAPQRRDAGEGSGPLSPPRGALGPPAPGSSVQDPISRPGLLPISPFLSCRAPLSRGAQPGPERGARTSCRRRSRRARAAGTKTPLPAPAPSPAQSTGWVRGWAPCGELDLVRCAGLGHLGAASAMLVRAAPPPPVRTWQFSPGIGARLVASARWVGRGVWDTPHVRG